MAGIRGEGFSSLQLLVGVLARLSAVSGVTFVRVEGISTETGLMLFDVVSPKALI